MAVVDRWHYARPVPGAGRCEHGLCPGPQHGAGLRWQVRWRDDSGVQRKRSFAKKAPAERWELEVRSALAAGAYVDDRNQTTVGEAALAWLEIRPHRPSTARRMRGLVVIHIVDVPLGSRRLAAVRPSEVQAWATDRSRHLSPLVLRQLVSTLRSVYRAAVLDRLVGSNPVGELMLPRHERRRIVPLTVDQVRALADAMPQRCRAMVVAQACLGLRLGELLGLRVADVNFLAREVHIAQQIDERGQLAPLKTPESVRTLPLPQVVADALAAHLAAYPADHGRRLIFTMPSGRPYGHSHYGYRIFKTAVAAAGLPPATSTHDLRHHYASLLLEQGQSVGTVAARLGHGSVQLVVSTYGHMMPGTEDRTRRAIDEAWSDASLSREELPK